MKSLFICSAVIVSALATSCIYDAPGDKFYRTLWISDDAALNPFDTSFLTLEFLCNGEASVTTTDKSRKITGYSYGTYSPHGLTATLEGMSIRINDLEFTFFEAYRDGDILMLSWKIEDLSYQFTTALKQRSSYN